MPTMATTVHAVRTPWKHPNLIVWATVLSVLFVLLYASVFRGLVLQWWRDPDYSHGFFVPLFSAFALWRERRSWMAAEIKPSNFGLVVMIAAVFLLILGSLGAELFTTRFSVIILLAGMILFWAGSKVLRAVAFPIIFLIFMIPIPAIIYNQITFPLQLLASRVAAFWLELVNLPVLRDGNVLVFSNYSLEVVEACSGIRSLVTLISLAVIYGYLVEPRRWAQWILAISMVPIAILSNAFRVMGAGAIAHRFGAEAAEGFLHTFSGWVIFLTALLALLGCHWILRHIGRGHTEAARA
jgi:exosortase